MSVDNEERGTHCFFSDITEVKLGNSHKKEQVNFTIFFKSSSDQLENKV